MNIEKLYKNERYKKLSVQAKCLYGYLKFKNANSNYFTFTETEQEKAVEYLQICTKTQKKALKELTKNGFIEIISNNEIDGKNIDNTTKKFVPTEYRFKEMKI